jgi:hypothetical protein
MGLDTEGFIFRGTYIRNGLTVSEYGGLIPGADPGGIECSSRYGQIFPIMDTKIVLGKNSILIYFHAIHFCLQK